jgi:hypothetical protein
MPAYFGNRRGLRSGSGDGALTLALDELATSASSAYSLRKLRVAYAGSAIKVRRSSDDTTQDIGFTAAGVLDTAAIATFVGANNGFIDTWYDQSGNSLNLTAASTGEQPRIVSAGTIDTRNTLPAIKFDGTDDWMRYTAGALSVQQISTVISINSASFPDFDGYVTGSAETGLIGDSASNWFAAGDFGTFATNNVAGNSPTFGGTLYAQAAYSASARNWAGGIEIGKDRNNAARFPDAWMTEILTFATTLSAGDDTTLQSSRAAAWSF